MSIPWLMTSSCGFMSQTFVGVSDWSAWKCRRSVFLAGMNAMHRVYARIKHHANEPIEDHELVSVLKTDEKVTLQDQV